MKGHRTASAQPSHGRCIIHPTGRPQPCGGPGWAQAGFRGKGTVVEISGLQLTQGTLGPGPTEAQGLGHPHQLSEPFLYTPPASKESQAPLWFQKATCSDWSSYPLDLLPAKTGSLLLSISRHQGGAAGPRQSGPHRLDTPLSRKKFAFSPADWQPLWPSKDVSHSLGDPLSTQCPGPCCLVMGDLKWGTEGPGRLAPLS